MCNMGYERILAVQDISCLGQCSMTVSLPILSACGHETCILPTMVLSTHTGGLGTPVRRDLTEDMIPIMEHWKEQGITFGCVYAGYLGKPEQVELVSHIAHELLAPEGVLVVDPAMADHGKLYSGISDEYVQKIKELCRQADVLLPNRTEAFLLADMGYETTSEEQVLKELEDRYGAAVVLTGSAKEAGKTGFALRRQGKTRFYSRDLVGRAYHGTGDMFASVFVGATMQGWDTFDAAVLAAEFVARVAENTCHHPAHAYGTKFETALPWLIGELSQKG